MLRSELALLLLETYPELKSFTKASLIVEFIFETIEKALQQEQTVNSYRFGTFKTITIKGKAINGGLHCNNKSRYIPDRQQVRFVPSEVLRKKVQKK